jgi:hypothetical protein
MTQWSDLLGQSQPYQKAQVEIPHDDGISPCPAAASVAGSSYYTFDQLGAAYGLGPVLADGGNGHGSTIGLVEFGSSFGNDIVTYMNCFGLTNPFSVDQIDGGGGSNAGGTAEADLDIEQAMTQAPGASIVSYEAPNGSETDAYDLWNAIVTSDTAQVVSTSWSQCEPLAVIDGELPALTPLFEQAASQGQTILAAAGDNGSEGCFGGLGVTSEQVDYPASDAWVTAVGGTTLFGPGNEQAWNNCEGDESVSCGQGGGGAGGGGMSRYEPRPSFQPNILDWPTAQSCGSECREVPDISANAGVPMVSFHNGAWTLDVGTSASTPFVAGMVADSDSNCGGTIGVLTPLLYDLYEAGSYGSAFNDITAGNTDLTGSNGGAYPARSGYDAATGIGSPIASGLNCTQITAVSGGYVGSQVVVSGLGLEHASIYFGSAQATVISASSTSATVIVPSGSGTVQVSATGIPGVTQQTSSFTYESPPPAPNSSPSPSPSATHGYWLVGSDGGIFTFGSAQFYGSTGSLKLNRPVVGIVPTTDRSGYWLDASDGGVFAFGDAGFYGSIPGLGLLPAGSQGPHALNASIVGMVPSADGFGYFMVAADGGVFAFGDAQYEGSCPGIGGCSGAAIAVMPDATGKGYWLVTQTGRVYQFGDAPTYGSPGAQGSTVTSAVRTPDGRGYWVLFANGAVDAFGDAQSYGAPTGQFDGPNPASAIFTTTDGLGYWVASSDGAVDAFGDAPFDGSMAGTKLNGLIIAASGF